MNTLSIKYAGGSSAPTIAQANDTFTAAIIVANHPDSLAVWDQHTGALLFTTTEYIDANGVKSDFWPDDPHMRAWKIRGIMAERLDSALIAYPAYGVA